MSSALIQKTIETYLSQQFVTKRPTVPMHFENTKFAKPTNSAWVYVTLIDGESVRANIGNPYQWKSTGVVNCQVLVPEDTGTRLCRSIIDDIFSILADRQIPMVPEGSITFCYAERRNRGTVGGWYAMNFVCEFRAWHQNS